MSNPTLSTRLWISQGLHNGLLSPEQAVKVMQVIEAEQEPVRDRSRVIFNGPPQWVKDERAGITDERDSIATLSNN